MATFEDESGESDSAFEAEKTVIPEKSREKYQHAYNTFMQWRDQNNFQDSLSEKVLLAYFHEKSEMWKPSTLWAQYSMIRSTLHLNNNVDISTYKKLIGFLKSKSKGFQSKKTKIFTSQDIYRFLEEAPDQQFLASKVILIFGITGACRSHELTCVTIKNVVRHGSIYVVKIPETKRCIPRSFTITEEFSDIVKKYAALRPSHTQTERFFLKYHNGKCSIQVIGINKFAKTPQIIANFLELQNPELYTGHSFRRTSATLLADSGANITTIKRHGGWKSRAVLRAYIEDSLTNRTSPSESIALMVQLPSISVNNSKNEPPPKRIKTEEKRQPSDFERAEKFHKFLKKKIDTENLCLGNIYNADESGINWRTLASCVLSRSGEEIPEHNENEDRVTALFCSNASGSHRIPLLIIGKAEAPKYLKNSVTSTLNENLKFFEGHGIIYTCQNKAWMDSQIFILWYKEVFIPRVLEHQRLNGMTGKVILILDNAPSHPSLDHLNGVNKNFEVCEVPSVMTTIQPMERGLISTTKKLYKKNLLRCLLVNDKTQGADKFLRNLSLRDCFTLLGSAWDNLKTSTLQGGWKPLLSDSFSADFQESRHLQDPLFIGPSADKVPKSSTRIVGELSSFPHEIGDQLFRLLSGPDRSLETSKSLLLDWFEDDDDDCGWGLSDDDTDFVASGQEELEISREFVMIKSEIEGNENSHKASESQQIPSETFEDIIALENCRRNDSKVRSEFVQVKCEMEDQEYVGSENTCEIQKVQGVTPSEALDSLMTIKAWMKSYAKTSQEHHYHINEVENLIRQGMSESPQNKIFLSL